MAWLTDNTSGMAEVELSFVTEEDDGPFIGIRAELVDEGRTLADLLVTTEAQADDLLRDVTEAVREFKKKLTGS